MTRRQLFRRRPLSLQAYIHRATVGLPRAERLDAAAELRTHLVERIDILRAEGHPADEAEFLAVQAMGDPAPTNRGLLGHAFTHRLGWLALGLVIIGGGGWYGYGYAQREWMPPREGVEYDTKLTVDDLQALNNDESAPKGDYQAITLTYPKGTKNIYYLLVTPSRVNLQENRLSSDIEGRLKYEHVDRIPGSYRYQERWLAINSKNTPCSRSWEIHTNISAKENKLVPVLGVTRRYLTDLPSTWAQMPSCMGVKRAFETEAGSLSEVFPFTSIPTHPDKKILTLNKWTVLQTFILDKNLQSLILAEKPISKEAALKARATAMYIAVLPSDRPVPKNYYLYKDEASSRFGFPDNNGVTALPIPPQFDEIPTIFQ
jgi:hypothetical protein